MKDIIKQLEQSTQPDLPINLNYKIGCIGAGFIMDDCQLVAYRKVGLNPVAISSLNRTKSEEVAGRHNLPKVYDSWKELVDDEEIEIIDIAVPPDVQLDIVRYAVTKLHIKGILCQKPVAMSLGGAREIAKLSKDSNIPIAINSNMRHDQSMKALKYALDKNLLGVPVLATIEMRAIPHWQEFLSKYWQLEIYSMGIHHVDIFRHLFGDPEKITALCRPDPRTQFEHTDGIVQFTYQYENHFMATSLDDVWAWPNDPCEKDMYIKWRVEGTKGMATGNIGWPEYPEHLPSTFKLTCHDYPGGWIEPSWDTAWFPDAFAGTMGDLLIAVEKKQFPKISAEDNVKTIACVEACYTSIKEERTVKLSEIIGR